MNARTVPSAAIAAHDTALEELRAVIKPAAGFEYDPLEDLLLVARVFKSLAGAGRIKSVRTRAAAERALAAFPPVVTP